MSQAGASSSGGGGGIIQTIDGDTGSITGAVVTIFANQATLNSGSSVEFVNSGTVSTLNVTDGGLNTIIGQDAGVSPNTAGSCTGLGAECLASITDDTEQTAVGRGALQSANDGSANTAIGAYALNALVAGGDNTALGSHAGIALASGNFNTMLGYFAGTSYTTSESSNILLGNAGVAAENNVIRIGTQGNGALEQDSCFIAGIAGVTVSNTNMVTIDTTTGEMGSQAVPSGGITTIDGDSGSVTGSTISLLANSGSANCGSSVSFTAASATEMDLVVTDSNSNTIIGSNCGNSSISGNSNVALGLDALTSLGSGSGNVGAGVNVLNRLVDGGYNFCFGQAAGYGYTGSESRNIIIGNSVYGTTGENDVIRIGRTDLGNQPATSCYVGGIVNSSPVDANSPQVVLCDNTGNLTVVPDSTPGYVLTSNSPDSPTFQAPGGGGAATAFIAYVSSTISGATGDGTFYLVQFDATTRNDGTVYDTATGLFTANKTGLWYFTAGIDERGLIVANSEQYLLFEYNGGAQYGATYYNPFPISASGRIISESVALISLSAGDTVGVRFDVIGNGTPNIDIAGSGSSLVSYFTGYFIGT